MNNELDKDLIRSVLNELLLLEDGDFLPHFSGVCKELFIAHMKKKGIEYPNPEYHPNLCPEYRWANHLADGNYVDTYGKMTQMRRDFIYQLLTLMRDENE
jgi:hypothetical protein